MTSAAAQRGIRGSASRPDDHIIVLFGATGDLARRKLLPGLFHLFVAGLLPDTYRIIGSARRTLTEEQFREHARQSVAEFGISEPVGTAWKAFARALSFGSAEPGRTGALVSAVRRADNELGGSPRRLFHLAIPPTSFEPTVTILSGCARLLRRGSARQCPLFRSTASLFDLGLPPAIDLAEYPQGYRSP